MTPDSLVIGNVYSVKSLIPNEICLLRYPLNGNGWNPIFIWSTHPNVFVEYNEKDLAYRFLHVPTGNLFEIKNRACIKPMEQSNFNENE